MQIADAFYINREWGNKLCDHPDFSREYYLGASTGDYNCKECGESFNREQMEAIITKRNLPKPNMKFKIKRVRRVSRTGLKPRTSGVFKFLPTDLS